MSQKTKTELQAFALRVEKQIIAANRKGSENMERLVCRLLTNKATPQISATMAQKWVEWRYGKATEHVQIDATIEHTVFDASRLSDEQLAEAERLIESAVAPSDQG
jgi:hypothetical protein